LGNPNSINCAVGVDSTVNKRMLAMILNYQLPFAVHAASFLSGMVFGCAVAVLFVLIIILLRSL
jgi:hypothetical protein